MNFSEIVGKIRKELIPKIETHPGIESYLIQGSKFEGWLQVEIVGLLKVLNDDYDIIPEHNNIDIVVGEWAFELKILSSKKKNHLPQNIYSLKEITSKLVKKSGKKNNVIIFLSYPRMQNNKTWEKHINFMKDFSAIFEEIEIRFSNLMSGSLFVNLLKN